MGLTSIEWTDRTWNPTRGCSRVSEGCRNCYAERIAARFSDEDLEDPINCDPPLCELDPPLSDKRTGVFYGFAIRTPSGPRWTGKVELIESKLSEPLHWKKPQRVFVNSMSDLFHEALPDDAIDRVFAIMALCPHITFQVLTKRPERMLKWFTPDWDAPRETWERVRVRTALVKTKMSEEWDWPLSNVWLGVSVEDQATADVRIPLLLQTPAAIRFVSYEPALGTVDFAEFFKRSPRCPTEACIALDECACLTRTGLDWIIAGGESGPGARPPHLDWFRQVRDQCIAADVAFFFKQWGEYFPRPGEAWMGDLHMERIGKKKAGALLDGREWKQFPLLVEHTTSRAKTQSR